MTEILSKDEIDALLTAVSNGEGPVAIQLPRLAPDTVLIKHDEFAAAMKEPIDGHLSDADVDALLSNKPLSPDAPRLISLLELELELEGRSGKVFFATLNALPLRDYVNARAFYGVEAIQTFLGRPIRLTAVTVRESSLIELERLTGASAEFLLLKTPEGKNFGGMAVDEEMGNVFARLILGAPVDEKTMPKLDELHRSALKEALSHWAKAIFGKGSAKESVSSLPLPAEKSGRRIRLYDFKRPSKFSRAMLRGIQLLHEDFAAKTTEELSLRLRTLAALHVTSIDQLTYEEFIKSLPNPTTLFRIAMPPLPCDAVLEIDPSISFSIIDRMLGGSGVPLNLSRELTEIEREILELATSRIIATLSEVWKKAGATPSLAEYGSNPGRVQVVGPDEMAVLVTFTARVSAVEGLVNLCLPYPLLAPILATIAPPAGESVLTPLSSTPSAGISEIRVSLGDVLLSSEEAHRLKPGTVIPLGNKFGVCLVRSEGRIVAAGDAVCFDDTETFGVRILDLPEAIAEDGGEIPPGAVRVEIGLGRTRLETPLIDELKPGAIIELDQPLIEPLSVLRDGIITARGEVFFHDNNPLVRIVSSAPR